jgi:hypothetical protein
MKRKYSIKKLDEDDILEIIIEHFQDGELADFMSAQGCILGEPGKDLRFVGVFSNEKGLLRNDLEKIDKEMDFNGDHSFLKKHPEFYISNTKEKPNKGD